MQNVENERSLKNPKNETLIRTVKPFRVCRILSEAKIIKRNIIVIRTSSEHTFFIPSTVGSFGGGQSITVIGSGITEETIVWLCSDQCGFTSLTDEHGEQRLICKTPPKDRSRNCKIKLENNGEFSGNVVEYTYDSVEATPVVNSISPNRGQVVGGTEITISGSGFEGHVTVMIGENVCEVTSVSFDEIICITSRAEKSQVLPVSVTVEKFGKQQEYIEFWYVNQWSSPRTWGCDKKEGCVNMPTDGDITEIPEGIDLLLDESTPLLHVLIVNGGKLIFDRELKCTKYIILPLFFTILPSKTCSNGTKQSHKSP